MPTQLILENIKKLGAEMRIASIDRKTKETDISVSINLDKNMPGVISTGVGFFDHMLQLLATHSGFCLSVVAKGDLNVDAHHTVEDVGIVLGKCFLEAIGEKRGIARYSSYAIPMDEALTTVSLDISGRAFLVFNADKLNEGKTGDFDCQLVEEFLRAFVNSAAITLHVNYMYGKNYHHIAESIFKGVAHALADATKIVSEDILSSKGVL